ncbi:MAG: amidohydrolase family protein [Deltaproteobacteria bacterium]|nr:amidohydrolase family protein [Deltaproteobacteria bacterium]
MQDRRVPQSEGAVHTALVPGFFDLQVNGFAGVDFNTPGVSAEALTHAAAAMAATGVTRFLPTFITCTVEHFTACVRPWLHTSLPSVAGFHLEGPYINGADGPRGAHPKPLVQPAAIDDFQRRQDAAQGRVRLLTLAPEMPGALALIEFAVAQGVVVAIGHSNANGQQVRDAVAAGATMSTHLGNATARTLPRYDNVIWQQLGADQLTAGLIVDGHHLEPNSVKIMVRAKTPGRAVLVTDAMAAAGQAPGRYTLGDIDVALDAHGRASRTDDGRLAGSALTMNRAVALVMKYAGVSFDEAVRMASVQPAACLQEQPRGTLDVQWDEAQGTLDINRVNV